MTDQDGLITAHLLDGKGGSKETGWDGIRDWNPDKGILWVHLDRSNSHSQEWLKSDSGLDPLVCDALLAEETRPRAAMINGGLLIILRGVNMNPGADPEDMVSIRMWFDGTRIISLRKLKIMAVEDIREMLEKGSGPAGSGDFLTQISNRLLERMGHVVEDIDDEIDGLEDEILESPSHDIRTKLSNLRRKAIRLRRFLSPQREVMSYLQMEKISWLADKHRSQLREVADRQMRHIENLDEARDRAAVTQEELAGRISDQMNKTMYILAMVATIFLPLGLLTGLFGINVAGMPGTENKYAFAIVCTILVVIVIFEYIIFRRKKLL